MSLPPSWSKNKPSKKPVWKQVATIALVPTCFSLVDFPQGALHYIPEDRPLNFISILQMRKSPTGSILCQLNPIIFTITCFTKIHFNIQACLFKIYLPIFCSLPYWMHGSQLLPLCGTYIIMGDPTIPLDFYDFIYKVLSWNKIRTRIIIF
jgi:hypothetical protein